jgi:hypothetical protein
MAKGMENGQVENFLQVLLGDRRAFKPIKAQLGCQLGHHSRLDNIASAIGMKTPIRLGANKED